MRISRIIYKRGYHIPETTSSPINQERVWCGWIAWTSRILSFDDDLEDVAWGKKRVGTPERRVNLRIN
jgi:hypothetical protein